LIDFLKHLNLGLSKNLKFDSLGKKRTLRNYEKKLKKSGTLNKII